MKEETKGVVGEDEQIAEVPEVEVPIKQNKKLLLVGVVAGILVLLALGILVFGRKTSTPSLTTDSSEAGNVADNIYENKEYYYQLTLPPKWSAVSLTASDQGTVMFTTSGEAMMSVTAIKQLGSLEAFLGLSDEEAGTIIKKSMPIKIGGYDATERIESWIDQGVEVVGSYVKIQDMIYSFNMLPTGNKNAVTNETLLREYRSVLASFKLTDTANIGKDWVSYAGWGWQLMYPQNWKLVEQEKDGKMGVKLYRDNYEITINQTGGESSVCQFADSEVAEGYAGDLRNKTYVELTTKEGLVLRRYFKNNMGDRTSLYFCGKRQEETQFVSPTYYGAIAYLIPAKYDEQIVKEMDNIILTIEGTRRD